MTIEGIQLNQVRRMSGVFVPGTLDPEKRTVEMSFASNRPVERAWGYEVLDHSATGPNMERWRSNPPLLFNHDHADLIGVIEMGRLADNKLVGVARFSRSPRGEQMMQDVQDGVLHSASIGYILDEKQCKQVGTRNGTPVYEFSNWMPYEGSLCPVGADPSVGVGRSFDPEKFDFQPLTPENGDASAIQDNPAVEGAEQTRRIEVTDMTEEKKEMPAGKSPELASAADVIEYARLLGDVEMGRQILASGGGIAELRAFYIAEKAKKQPETPATMLDLSRKEVKRYSIVRALRSAIDGKFDADNGGFEFECHAEIEKRIRMGDPSQHAKLQCVSGRSILMPYDKQIENLPALRNLNGLGEAHQHRTVTVGTGGGSTGGQLVGQEWMPENFIELLRSALLPNTLGATFMPGLVGNVAIPRQNSPGSVYWVAEDAAPTTSDQGFGQLTMTPKTMGARTSVTRQMMLQGTPAIEAIIMKDIAETMARGLQRAFFTGSNASGQPKGIVNHSGVNAVTPSGAAGVVVWEDIIKMETEIFTDNAPAPTAWVTTPAVRGLFKGRVRLANTAALTFMGDDNRLMGYPLFVTTDFPAATLLFGNFSQCFIGEWGVIEITPNPWGSGFAAGTTEIRSLQSLDIACRHAVAFALLETIL